MCLDCGCGSNDMNVVSVEAGPRDRDDVFVTMECCPGTECSGAHEVYEVDEDGNAVEEVPCQCVVTDFAPAGEPKGELIWKIDHMDAGATKRFAVGPGEAEEKPTDVAIDITEGDRADFTVNGDFFTSYVVRDGIPRPFCAPVTGPGGLEVTREVNFPPKEGIDHIHHKGIWVAQGDVNGHDNWSEQEGHAKTVNRELTVDAQGPLFAQLHAFNDWVTADDQKLLREDTFIRLYNTPDTGRIMDLNTVWTAAYGGVFFADTKEAGTVSIRLKESMEEREGGTIVNAFGAIGEAENWGKPSPWVDYYGPVQDRVCGVTIMDHPDNFRYPTTWHVRGYGLFTANQWGIHDFTGDWSRRGDYAMEQGQSLCFRFRIYIHEGSTKEANPGEQWLNWAFGPCVSEPE
ncbi:MAG: PmoA family protein [Armatimonadota bacterium]